MTSAYRQPAGFLRGTKKTAINYRISITLTQRERNMKSAGKRLISAILLMPFIAGLILPLNALAQPPAFLDGVDAKIEIVFPHGADGQPRPVETAPQVNVEVYLFKRGTKTPVDCSFDTPVILRWAENRYGVSTLIPAHDDALSVRNKTGEKVMRKINGVRFPAWVFNDIDVSQAIFNSRNQYYFFAEVKGQDYRTNVWAHGIDARTYLPTVQATRSAYGEKLTLADAYIDILWPKDEAGRGRPVNEAPLANIGVRLEQHGDNQVGPKSDADIELQLWRALNDGYLILDTKSQAQRRDGETRLGGTKEPWWDFNNVDVSDAIDPNNRIFFTVKSRDLPLHTTVWVHGADSRTFFPHTDTPLSSCSN
jgi:hypothetical protein